MMLKVNQEAPEFMLEDQNKNKVSLKNFDEKWIVIYFYPKDDTPGCTIEAIEFTKKIKNFNKLNCVIIGISPDSIESHCKFIEKHDIKLILLSDPLHKILKKYDVWGLKKLYGREYYGVKRTTFLINPDKKISYIWENVKVENHAEDVNKKLNEFLAPA